MHENIGQNTTTGASFGGFGAAGQQTGTGHAKFNPVNGKYWTYSLSIIE